MLIKELIEGVTSQLPERVPTGNYRKVKAEKIEKDINKNNETPKSGNS